MSITYRSIALWNDPTDPESPSTGLKLHLTEGFTGGISVRGKDVIVPARAGRVWMPRIGDVRRLLIEGWVTGADRSEWREWTDLLGETFDPVLDPGEIKLVGPYLGIEVGVEYTIDARVLNLIAGPILAGMTAQHWSIELESVDPDWVSSGS